MRSYGPDMVLGMCDLDLGGLTLDQSHYTLLSQEQVLGEILSRSNLAVRSYGHGFWVCVHRDLHVRDMNLGQGHDTPLGH